MTESPEEIIKAIRAALSGTLDLEHRKDLAFYEKNYAASMENLLEALSGLCLTAHTKYNPGLREVAVIRAREEALIIKTWIEAAIDYKAMIVMERLLRGSHHE